MAPNFKDYSYFVANTAWESTVFHSANLFEMASMSFSKLEIETNGPMPCCGRFLLDGHEIKGLREVHIDLAHRKVNEARMTVLLDEVKVDVEVLTYLRGQLELDPDSLSPEESESLDQGIRIGFGMQLAKS